MPIMTHAQWMAATRRGLLKPRSAQLVAIDDALAQYERTKAAPDLKSLKKALGAWCGSKGPAWKSSTRNSGGAVEQLVQQVDKELAGSVVKFDKHRMRDIERSVDQANVIDAARKIEAAITKAQAAAQRAPFDPREKTRLETWFGTDVKHNDVRGVYARVYQGIAGGLEFVRDDDPKNENTFAYVRPTDPARPRRVYLCRAFWKHGRIEWTKSDAGWSRKDQRDCNDNPLGVLVHELTHLFAGTDDHAYGRTGCQNLARTNPKASRMNADSYEYYCEDVVLTP